MSNSVKIVGPDSSAPVKISPPAGAVYSNVARLFATPNEVVLDFALNLNAFGPMVDEEAQIVSRVVTSYDGAKRLWMHLTQTLQAYEKKYGPIELDVAKRMKEAP
ncbi:uncharacterized protein DUF3467 [Prosthecobacter fusiformis]|uniref:Uncharacterized protein DUF3467 n=1 Tax=Prosthecobacter fusiformis TaxID=48464 RepID=A0A4R7RL29_9BACT|nr:DUF3467 domain-containing protein [Prosthecobacter fusiformis]TDU66041.1 uncharacterized protein DUF3467 [Prosthecobacter fusiformis]